MNPEKRWVKIFLTGSWLKRLRKIRICNTSDDWTLADSSPSEIDENAGTMILDASCAPQERSFSQDINILNKAREDPEAIIDDLCERIYYYKPRFWLSYLKVYEPQKYMYDYGRYHEKNKIKEKSII